MVRSNQFSPRLMYDGISILAVEPTPRRMGIIWLLAWTHLWTLVALLLVGRAGTAIRLFAEQVAWAFGLALTGGRNPDGYVLALHLAAVAALGIAMWLWQRGDHRTRPFLRVAAVAQFSVAPLGVPIGVALWWVSRHHDLQEATERMAIPGGSARLRILIVWLGATLLTIVAAVGAYILFQVNLLLWLGAALAAALPQFAALAMLMAEPKRPTRQITPTAMPPLPDIGRHP